jgi:hypothetical protein
LEVHRDNYVMAQKYVDNSRELLDAELAALVGYISASFVFSYHFLHPAPPPPPLLRTSVVQNNNYEPEKRSNILTFHPLSYTLTYSVYSESYNRAYKVVVRIQQLSELEEIMEYKKSKDNLERQGMIRNTWKQR